MFQRLAIKALQQWAQKEEMETFGFERGQD